LTVPFIPRGERNARGMEPSGFKTSKYIQGLANFAKIRLGASGKDAISIAFAIAHKQRVDGVKAIPFLDKAEQRIAQLIQDNVSKDVEKFIYQKLL